MTETGLRRVLDNLGAIAVAYLVASVAAGFAYKLILAAAIQITGAIENPSEMTTFEQLRMLLWFATFASIFIGVISFIPSLPMIGGLIALGRTDLVSFILAGTAISVVSVLTARNVIFFDRLEISWLSLSSGAIAGATFGLMFHTLARSA